MLKNIIYFFSLIISAIFIYSCSTDFDFQPVAANQLHFSKDTVYLDTIFTNTSSSTYQLKVYNTSDKNIIIPQIYLEKKDSKFRISVDGLSNSSFSDVEILAKDSLFIFVETTVDIKKETNNTDFLYTDALIFKTQDAQKRVELVSLVKDAIFLYPQKLSENKYENLIINEQEIYGFFLDENDAINGNELHFTNKKPYVIYGYAAVPPQKKLEIDEGAQIHFHQNSGLIVYPDAEIQVKGSIEKPIIFQGDRLEPQYEDIPGQWGMILLAKDSKATFENAIIKNGTIGLMVNSFLNEIEIKNLQIYNCTNYGLLGRYANIKGENIVVNNCGKSSLAITYGGNYVFTHCTFANYWNQTNAVALSIDATSEENPLPLQATFNNSIIYGRNMKNLSIKTTQNNTDFSLRFNYCLIKYDDNTFNNSSFPYDFDNQQNYNHCLIANNTTFSPQFYNPNKNILIPTDAAESIIGYGKNEYAEQVPEDITGKNRQNSADLGAYQHQSFPEENKN